MLDRTRRLVSGAVNLAKDVVGPGKKVEEGRPGLDAFADGIDASGRARHRYYSGSGWDEASYTILPAFGVLADAGFLSEAFDGDGGDSDGGWDFGGGDGGDGGGGD